MTAAIRAFFPQSPPTTAVVPRLKRVTFGAVGAIADPGYAWYRTFLEWKETFGLPKVTRTLSIRFQKQIKLYL